jgi:D-alanyl-D-alanine carboxypeptidase
MSSSISKIQAIFAESKHIGQGEVALFGIFDRHTKTADFVTHGPISSSNVLRLGSITKIFLSYVALKAQIPLDKPVATVLPELADETLYQCSSSITFEQCLLHTTGIVNYSMLAGAENYEGIYTPTVTVDMGWKNKPLLFPPGSEWHYSNTNSEVVAMAVEKITGKPIKQLVEEAFSEIAPTLTFDSGVAQPYPLDAPNYAKFKMPWSFPSASGRLIATPLDAMKAIDSMARETVWQTMQTWSTAPRRTPDPEYDPAGGKKYGYYLQEFDFSVPVIGHDGHINVTSLVGATPDYVFLVHTSSDIDTQYWMPLCNGVITAALKK